MAISADYVLPQRRCNWFRACRNSGHAVCSIHHTCNGERCERSASQPRPAWRLRPLQQSTARSRCSSILWRVRWPRGAGKGTGRGNSGRRRDRNLGVVHKKLARRFSACASARHRGVLLGSAAVVCDLCATESRLSKRIYLPAQFRTLPNACIPAQTTLLVLWTDNDSGPTALDRILGWELSGRRAPLAREIMGSFAGLLLRLLGNFPDRVLQLFAV